MNSYLVIGMGRFGKALATELFKCGHEVCIIDELEENVSGITDHVTNAMVGDAKDEAVLKSLGVQNFDCVIVAIGGSIEDSMLITLLLKDIGAKKIVCKAQNDRHARALTLIGADSVVRPEEDMGKRLARSMAQKNLIDLFELSSDYSIVEIITPSHWADKSIVANNLRRKYGITVLAIRTSNRKSIKISPSPDTVLKPDDILVVIGSAKDVKDIISMHSK